MKDPQPIPHSLKVAHLYLVAAADADKTVKEKNQHRDMLKPWIMDNCEQDENGNYFYEFPEPINIDGTWYSGLMAQRRVSEWTDEAKVLAYLAQTTDDIWNRCVQQVVVDKLDLDAVYALNQEGIISDETVDSFIDTEESWALVKVKR